MFVRCPPRIHVAAVRLDIRTTVKSVQTSHLPRLVVLLVLLTQTSRDLDACVNIVNIHVDIVGQSAMTGKNCRVTLRRSTIVGDLFVLSVSVRTSPEMY